MLSLLSVSDISNWHSVIVSADSNRVGRPQPALTLSPALPAFAPNRRCRAGTFSRAAALPGNPKVSAPLAHLKGRFHAVLRELVLKLNEVIHSACVIGIDRDPLAALIQRVNGVQPYCYPRFQVVSDSFLAQ